MDENCLRQFKVAGMKFRVGLAQQVQGSLQSGTADLAVAGDKCGSTVVRFQQQFAIEGR
ncbi:hypothetical protein D3C87_2153880 [compost metagenome]